MHKTFKLAFSLIFLALSAGQTWAADSEDKMSERKEYNNPFTYDSDPKSPALNNLGVQVALDRERFKVGHPIQVHGTYEIDLQNGKQIKSGNPLREIKLIIVRRDKADVWSGDVVIGPEWAAVPEAPKSDQDKNTPARQSGYFNGDLTQICPLLKQLGSYWVMATMGDYVSDRIEFTISAH